MLLPLLKISVNHTHVHPLSKVHYHLSFKLNITRTGCGSTKLCVSSATTCNLTGNSSCFFSSVQVKNQTLSIELSGTTTGYVALGLSKQGSTIVFVCGNNNDSLSTNFFFETATIMGTTLLPVNVSAVYNITGVVSETPSLVQCIFNTSTSLNITSLRSSGIFYSITLMNGTTNGKQLGAANILYDSGVPVNLQSGSTSIVSLWAHGKGRELADMMERRKVDILCVQETRWKGSKARSIGAGFNLQEWR
ncbi:hypothetical protein QTP70_008239 [Hemibagrus guttatus]|uniref:Uncharacterized protein n=1 Tax=Hemibagrus guttatus TaxID=175788 RepID=A0AAE0R7R7_9TELE|nr:hypothetical protein QTP70_008239 [Hemibagrus guttatus]